MHLVVVFFYSILFCLLFYHVRVLELQSIVNSIFLFPVNGETRLIPNTGFCFVPSWPSHPCLQKKPPKTQTVFTVSYWLYIVEGGTVLDSFSTLELKQQFAPILMQTACHHNATSPSSHCYIYTGVFFPKYLKAESRTLFLRKWKRRKWICYSAKQKCLYEVNVHL